MTVSERSEQQQTFSYFQVFIKELKDQIQTLEQEIVDLHACCAHQSKVIEGYVRREDIARRSMK